MKPWAVLFPASWHRLPVMMFCPGTGPGPALHRLELGDVEVELTFPLFKTFKVTFYLLCVRVCMACVGQMTTCGSWFSAGRHVNPRVKPDSSEQQAPPNHWAISPALCLWLELETRMKRDAHHSCTGPEFGSGTHVDQFTASRNSSSRRTHTLFWRPRIPNSCTSQFVCT